MAKFSDLDIELSEHKEALITLSDELCGLSIVLFILSIVCLIHVDLISIISTIFCILALCFKMYQYINTKRKINKINLMLDCYISFL